MASQLVRLRQTNFTLHAADPANKKAPLTVLFYFQAKIWPPTKFIPRSKNLRKRRKITFSLAQQLGNIAR